ncbi:TPA: hypothetical protein P1M42_000086 [Clostridioides difficile]|uniref:Uncharacterized protein n=1 Tax=Clostridioides difficile ATCC 9689 = DSM 1296 TaxID=1121308 RepID=A0ACA7UP09_CLODI|nr:hypothetical protein [Clostridioides difficile]YP_009221715.1 hypothetical protein PHICD211_20112 [Clostridium phage phiCD211]AKP44791.1 hypothetical protein CDIF1296T_phi117 [Peptoclostridium phage phiCDIF1296T]ARC16964.1 hypothetical protein A6J95_19580 [Clostridioides difficile]AVI14426.1 hypothetical protein C4J70_19575 [Clostridioides difficile]EGT3678983.1 hypothetical protein [Clostridioides difficile]EGT4768813.1 hypothetical protein [Clostridioides difficile]
MFIKGFRCICRHKFSRIKDCYLITTKSQQHTCKIWVCKYCGQIVAGSTPVYHPNMKVNEYCVKCELLACSNNYEGYCNSKDKEIEFKSICLEGNKEILQCKNFDLE